MLHVKSCFCFLLIRKKTCAARAKFVFSLLDLLLLFFTVLVVFTLFIVLLDFYIFYEETINMKESFAFSPEAKSIY